jgi:ABC-type Zn uptake system ZnuABC Zn-binding protein ZnuA
MTGQFLRRHSRPAVALLLVIGALVSGCAAAPGPAARDLPTPMAAAGTGSGAPRVLAVETFLADIAQNVAGDRLHVSSLLSEGVDPHSFEPAPGDVAKVAQSTVLIVNGAGVEGFLDRLLQNAGGQRLEIVASAGLTSRTAREGEAVELARPGAAAEPDPHFWLDPTKVITYVTNIRDGLTKADPAGAATYAANADAYIRQLRDLDQWIASQVQQIPPEQRVLVTNHEEFGYFADRYGFKVIGTVIPSTSTEASPSAQELARLIDRIKATHARALFLEAGTNQQLAQQVAGETGARVVADLVTHWTTAPKGIAPNYIAMMKHDTTAIVNALK